VSDPTDVNPKKNPKQHIQTMSSAFPHSLEKFTTRETARHRGLTAVLKSRAPVTAALALALLSSAWGPRAEASGKTATTRPAQAAEARHTTPGDVVSAFAKHFNAGQHEQLLGLYDSKAVFVPAPGKPVNTPEGIRAATGQFMGMRLPIQIAVRHVYESGDLALVVSDWTIQGKTPSGDPVDLAGTATDVLRKSRAKGWLYLIDNPFGGQLPQQ
jgi:ketosteroid isomerase-like protein